MIAGRPGGSSRNACKATYEAWLPSGLPCMRGAKAAFTAAWMLGVLRKLVERCTSEAPWARSFRLVVS